MKIKMVKMGMDIDEIRNHRIRGIVTTDNGEYLFIEISKGSRPERIYTSLSQKEYENMYPYEEYILIESCFRVDIPKDHRDNYTKKYSKYERMSFRNYKHTKENIIKVLQQFNRNIDDIELTDDYYLDKFCEERGFYRLYDDRLEHSYEPLEIIWYDLEKNGESCVKFLYTCYSANGIEYTEEMQKKTKTSDLINKYGKEKVKNLINKYIEKRCLKFSNPKIKEICIKARSELFGKNEVDSNDNIDIDY